jgi:DNA polymerase-3 subunit delta
MPEKKAEITYGALMKDLKARHFSPIYILEGDESYYIDKISNYIADNVLSKEQRDFNQTIVFGADISAAQIIDQALSYPVMAEYQVIIVKESQNIRGSDLFEKYFAKPSKTSILVFCHKNGFVDHRKKMYSTAVAAGGIIFESKKLRDRDLPGFIETYLHTNNVTIEPKASQMIADHIGADLNRLTSELDKLLISFSENDRRVTPDIVEQEIGVSKDFNGFELKNAIINKDVFKANQIVKYFDSNPKAGSVYSFLPLLFSYFQNLIIAYYAPNNQNPNSVASFLNLRSPWAARDYITGMKYYPGNKTMQIIEKMRELDAKSKGINNPNTDAGQLMKELIYFILH